MNAPLVLAFAALCVAATGLGALTGDASARFLFSTYHSSLVDPLTYLRDFTNVLGHAGWEHLVGNMDYALLHGLFFGRDRPQGLFAFEMGSY